VRRSQCAFHQSRVRALAKEGSHFSLFTHVSSSEGKRAFHDESLSSRALGCCEFDCDDYCMYYNDALLKASNGELKDFSVRRCTGRA
jgi:hypothetical protein